MKVLYVDRDERHREFVETEFEGVETASSIEEAREKYDDQHVVSDYILGGYDTGLDLMDEVDTGFTLHTAYDREFVERDSGRSLTGVDFVRKANDSWEQLRERLGEQ